MQKVKEQEAKEYYIKATIQLGWSRNVTKKLPRKLAKSLPSPEMLEKGLKE